jgi:hypothetical protein
MMSHETAWITRKAFRFRRTTLILLAIACAVMPTVFLSFLNTWSDWKRGRQSKLNSWKSRCLWDPLSHIWFNNVPARRLCHSQRHSLLSHWEPYWKCCSHEEICGWSRKKAAMTVQDMIEQWSKRNSWKPWTLVLTIFRSPIINPCLSRATVHSRASWWLQASIF